MNVLSAEEIEKLKKTHPQKKILRLVFLVVGTILILTGLLLLLFGFDFGIIIDNVNFSFVIDILICVLGMILASKFFIAPYYLRENSLTIKKVSELREPVLKTIKFKSIALTRLISACILIAAGIATYIIFGIDVKHEVKYGSAVVLGGPSFFYLTGLPALGFGLGLLIYFFLSPFKGTFSQSENFYFFYEVRPLCPWLTEIPKKDIEAIRYQNNHLGPKLTWIIIFMPFIVLQLMTGIPLFASEKAGPLHVLSWTFLIISIIEIIVLIILVCFQQDYYEIATQELLYEMWFSPLKSKKKFAQFTSEMSDFLKCGIPKDKLIEGQNDTIFKDVSNTHFQMFNVIFGLFLIASSIIILTQMVLFGPLFWWIALMYGFILLVKAFSYDFSDKGGDKFLYDPEKKIFKFQRFFKYKFHQISAFKVEHVKVRKWFRRLDFFDIFGLGGMLIMLTVQQVEGWSIADALSPIVENIIGTFFVLVVFFFIFLYLCLPIDVIEFKTPSITYRTRITLKLKEESLFKKYKKNFKEFRREVQKEDLKKVFRIRLTMMLVLIIVPLTYTVLNLIAYFI